MLARTTPFTLALTLVKGAGMNSLEALQRTSDGLVELESEAEPRPASSFDGFGQHRLIAAMGSLPRPWRDVLWHVEVLGETPDATATALGMTDSEVTSALVQAREGLRRAYGL